MSKESLQALEVDLADLKKKLDLAKNEKMVANSLLKSGNKDIELFTKTAEHHRTNLVYMKGPAEEVNLNEFYKTKTMYLDAKDSLIIARQQVSQASKVIIKMENAIISLNVEIQAIQKALNSYGELVEFPKKIS